jgi:transcriptional regulator with XRE-family HTH domain
MINVCSIRTRLEELATKASVDKQTIHRIEHGKLKRSQRETIGRLCKALDVEERTLIGGHAREMSDYEDDIFEPKHLMRQNVSAGVSNAYLLVARRYNVSIAQIVELALS